MNPIPNAVGGNAFQIAHKICEGAFGKIYQGIYSKTRLKYAIKFEPENAEFPQLQYEFQAYRYLHRDWTASDKGIPRAHQFWTEGNYNILVMDLMGPSLESLFQKSQGKFSLKTVLMLIDQMITRVQYLHSRNLLHRDIKPDNLCLGSQEDSNKLYVIDFGLCKRNIQRNGKPIPYLEEKSLAGTPRYASTHTHLGIQQACRDDMESVGYVAMYFLRGKLPWQGLKARNMEEKYERIKIKKVNTDPFELCEGYPIEFGIYINHCRNLRFDEKPAYKDMRNMFRELFHRQGYRFDYRYDWVVAQEEREEREKKEKKTKGKWKQKQQKQNKGEF